MRVSAATGGRMWREIGQLLYRFLDTLKEQHKIGKIEAIADSVGWETTELHKKISRAPETPMALGEMWAVEAEMERAGKETYERYLQTLHNNDRIRVL